MFIALAAVVLVAALAFVGYRLSSGEGIPGIGASSTLSPSDTVQQYLEALAAGDAQKALSFGASQPGNTELLTDEILAQQNAAMPITNIRILGENNAGEAFGRSIVQVSVNFGDVVDDAQVPLQKDPDGVWKLERAVVKVKMLLRSRGANKDLDTVTVFGKKLDKGALYVFPGYIDIASTNEYVEVTSEPVQLLKGLAAQSSSNLMPQIALNEAGSDAVQQAIADAFAKCQASNQFNPPGCPAEFPTYFTRDAVDGTVSWGEVDLSELYTRDLQPRDMTVKIGGTAKIPVSFQLIDGDTKRRTIESYILGAQADMTTTPPTLTWP